MSSPGTRLAVADSELRPGWEPNGAGRVSGTSRRPASSASSCLHSRNIPEAPAWRPVLGEAGDWGLGAHRRDWRRVERLRQL